MMALELDLLEGDFIKKDSADVAIFLKDNGIADEICESFEGMFAVAIFLAPA